MDIQTKDGILLRGIPDGTPEEAIKARIAKIRAEGGAKPAPAPEIPMSERRNIRGEKVEPSFAEDAYKTVADVATGASSLMRGTANLLPGKLGDKMWPKSTNEGAAKVVGEVLDPVAWTIGGGIAKALPYVPVLGKGVIEGGKALLRNAAGGAAAGGTIGALSDDADAATGAGFGAAANVVVPPLLSAGGKAAGKVYDALTGQMAKIKAGDVLRQAAGDDLPAVRAAYANAAPGETASQATAGLKRDTLDALGKFASTADETSFYSRHAASEKQGLIEAIRKIAGGANQTEARQSAEGTQKALNKITTPMRETELAAANTAGTTGARLQSEADQLAAAASSKVQDVRRMAKAGDAADAVAQSGRGRLGADSQPVGMPRLGAKYSYGAELSELAERVGKQSADDSLLLGQSSRFKQMQADSLAEHGLKPLDGGSIIRSLSAKIADPKIGSETLKEKVLTSVRGRLEQWTNSGGVIDASALYGIRKSAVNDAIEQLLGASDPKSKSQAAAGILKEVKPLIDDAIEAAGGTGWRNYLKTFEEGMTQVSQKKMGAKALQLLEANPKSFEVLVAGNKPERVAKVFGNEYDIGAAMGDKIKPMRAVADALARNRSVDEGAARGGQALRGIIDENIPSFKLFNVLDPRVALMNRVLGEGEIRIGEAMKRNLIEGMKSGKSAEALINALPLSERNKVVKALVDQQGKAAQYATRAATIGAAQQGEQ